MENSTQHIKNLIRQLGIETSDEAWQDFESIWEEIRVKRKEPLSVPGKKENHLYFITEGVQRVFYFDEQNREATIVFTYPYSFGGVLDAFLLQSPSRYYYETLSASVLLRTTHSRFEEVTRRHDSLRRFTTLLLHHVLSGLLERMTELQCFSSEEKFRRLLQRSPQLLQHVPHKYIANYLGIDPSNFSKLINSVKI